MSADIQLFIPGDSDLISDILVDSVRNDLRFIEPEYNDRFENDIAYLKFRVVYGNITITVLVEPRFLRKGIFDLDRYNDDLENDPYGNNYLDFDSYTLTDKPGLLLELHSIHGIELDIYS